MASRISFSGQQLELSGIVAQYIDVEASLKSYFSPSSPNFAERFAGYIESEVRNELKLRLMEHELSTIFSILSALEAAFRIDYIQRCYRKRKDPLSKNLRALHRKKGSRVSLEDEILESWKEYAVVSNKMIGDLKGALKYRHWLAHGRYWEPRLGQKYDYDNIYILAETVFNSFPLEGI